MRKDEYISAVISQIQNKKARAEVEREISAHIDDRISYYTDAGWDEETANEKAVEHMGEPEKIGEQMSRLHKKVYWWQYSALLPLIFFSLVAYLMLFLTADDRSTAGEMMLYEHIYISLLLVISLFGKTRKDTAMTLIPLLSYLFYLIEYLSNIFTLIMGTDYSFSSFGSPVVVSAVYTLLGRFGSINDIHSMCYIQMPWWLNLLSVMFYLSIAVLLCCSYKSVNKSGIRTLGSAFTKVMVGVTLGVSMTLVITAASIWLGNFSDSFYNDDYVLIERNEQVEIDPSSIECGAFLRCNRGMSFLIDYAYLTPISDDFASIIEDNYCEFITEEYDDIISHKVSCCHAYYKPSSEYLYLTKWKDKDGEMKISKNGTWAKTDIDQELTVKIDSSNYVYIHVIKADNQNGING